MTRMTFTMISDDAHGWLKVSPEQAAELGITQDDLTEFSYIDSEGTLFAEEDCDFATVWAAHLRKYDVPAEVRDVYAQGSSYVRTLPRCRGRHPQYREAMDWLNERDARMNEEAGV